MAEFYITPPSSTFEFLPPIKRRRVSSYIPLYSSQPFDSSSVSMELSTIREVSEREETTAPSSELPSSSDIGFLSSISSSSQSPPQVDVQQLKTKYKSKISHLKKRIELLEDQVLFLSRSRPVQGGELLLFLPFFLSAPS